MRNALLAIGVASLLIATAIGASAFQTASVDRSATVSVAADNNALIGLEDGGSGNVVSQSGNRLSIDTGNLANANGVNENATYHLGNLSQGTASEVSAFNITNNDASQKHGFKLSFNKNATSAANVTFVVYKGLGSDMKNSTKVGKVVNGGSFTTANTLNSSQKLYVEMVINTHNGNTGNLSGNLNVTATA